MGIVEVKDIGENYRSGYVENHSFGMKIKIHFIEKNYQNNKPLSLIASPGLWEPAERMIPLFDGLDCHCISLSYRGRGYSDTPLKGYDLKHHVSDFLAVVEALAIKSFGIVAFSKGVSYACGYATMHPEKIKGMIIVDYPAIHIKPSSGYAAFWKNLIYLGNPITNYIRAEALDRIEEESHENVFWEEMSQLNFPVTILRGTNKQSKIPSNLSDEDIAKYRKYLKDYQEVNFEYSGHMIVDEELGKYRIVVNDFIEMLTR